MKSKQTFTKLPAVLSTQRCFCLSDAAFENVYGNGRPNSPVQVIRHGVRATNNSIPKNSNSDKAQKEKDVRNLQTIDSAKLDLDATCMSAEFRIGFLDIENGLASIAGENAQEIKNSYFSFINRAKNSEGLNEIGRRYARNIFNARWLFRNRMVARSILVSVHSEENKIGESDALSHSINNFDDYIESEIKLGLRISEALRGKISESLKVVAKIQFIAGGGSEVFPSQNYQDKENSPKNSNKKMNLSRSLYVLNKEPHINMDEGPALVGQAALRDQKVSNALRTIDTWYNSEETCARPIPVEQFGANLEELKFFRNQRSKNAFHFMKNLNILDPNTSDGMFMIACLIRGAVYAGDK